MNKNTKQCPFCGRYITLSNFNKHILACKQNPDHLSNLNNQKIYTCKYCGRISHSAGGNLNHELSCKYNPNRRVRIGWAKGLTKDSNMYVKLHGETYSKNHKLGLHKKVENPSTRPDVRKKISQSMLGNHNNNPSKTGRGKKGWYKGFYCSSTYELAFIIYCLDNNIPVKKYKGYYLYEYKNKTHRYYPDFIINDTIVEIKGFWTEQVEAKTQSVKDKHIMVLYKKDMKDVFDYIKEKYDKIVDKNIEDLYECRSG